MCENIKSGPPIWLIAAIMNPFAIAAQIQPLQLEIVNIHNEYRGSINEFMDANGQNFPRPSNMYKLQWDRDLADASLQSAVSRCAGNMVNSWDLYARSENTQRVSLPEGLETLLPVDKVEFLQGLMGAWFEQGSLEYDFINQTCVTSNTNCKHFENMMAATTHRVGCSVSRCENDFLQSSDYMVSCQYWPMRVPELTPLYDVLDLSKPVDENSCTCLGTDTCLVESELDENAEILANYESNQSQEGIESGDGEILDRSYFEYIDRLDYSMYDSYGEDEPKVTLFCESVKNDICEEVDDFGVARGLCYPKGTIQCEESEDGSFAFCICRDDTIFDPENRCLPFEDSVDSSTQTDGVDPPLPAFPEDFPTDFPTDFPADFPTDFPIIQTASNPTVPSPDYIENDFTEISSELDHLLDYMFEMCNKTIKKTVKNAFENLCLNFNSESGYAELKKIKIDLSVDDYQPFCGNSEFTMTRNQNVKYEASFFDFSTAQLGPNTCLTPDDKNIVGLGECSDSPSWELLESGHIKHIELEKCLAVNPEREVRVGVCSHRHFHRFSVGPKIDGVVETRALKTSNGGYYGNGYGYGRKRRDSGDSEDDSNGFMINRENFMENLPIDDLFGKIETAKFEFKDCYERLERVILNGGVSKLQYPVTPALDSVAHKILASNGACLTLIQDHDNVWSIQPGDCNDASLDGRQRWFWNGQDGKVRLQGNPKFCWSYGTLPKPQKVVYAKCSEKYKQKFNNFGRNMIRASEGGCVNINFEDRMFLGNCWQNNF